MNKLFGIGALAFAVVALTPATPLEAANPHVFRVSAVFADNGDGADCERPVQRLDVFSTQADVDVVQVVWQIIRNPCTDPQFDSVQGSGLVDVDGNLSHLTVRGSISSGDRTIDIDLRFDKIGNVPDDPRPVEKTVSAVATGTVILDGDDLTLGQPSDDATITRSKR